MKYLFCILFILLSSEGFSQTKKTFNTTIDQANKVEVKGGLITIKKANEVIVKIYTNTKTKTKLFLSSYAQMRDSTGLYTTKFLIKSPAEFEYYDIDIRLKFNKPIENISWETGLGFGMEDKDVSNKIEPRLKMRKCECDDGIAVTITSKEKVICSIYGIDGNL